MMFNFNFFSGPPSFSLSSSTHPKYTSTAYPPALSQYLPQHQSSATKRTHDEMNGYWAHPDGPLKPSFGEYLSSYADKLRRKKRGVSLNREGLRRGRGYSERNYRRNDRPQHYDYGYEDEFRYQPPYQPAPVPQPVAADHAAAYHSHYAPQQGYVGVRTRHKIAKAKERSRHQQYSQYPPASAYYMGTQDYPTVANLGSQRTTAVPIIPAYIIDTGYEDYGRRKLRRVGRLYNDNDFY